MMLQWRGSTPLAAAAALARITGCRVDRVFSGSGLKRMVMLRGGGGGRRRTRVAGLEVHSISIISPSTRASTPGRLLMLMLRTRLRSRPLS